MPGLTSAKTIPSEHKTTESNRWDELSKLPFKDKFPTPETSARLYDELQLQRSVQVYLWALPANTSASTPPPKPTLTGRGRIRAESARSLPNSP
jgi:hypothetical protein